MPKAKRSIIKIDEEKCDGCGLCVPSCKEGAIQIINGKAKLVSETYCDGLGACLGECPLGAITIEEREAEEFDEEAVEKHLALDRHGLRPRDDTPNPAPLACGCPGSMAKTINKSADSQTTPMSDQKSELANWPIQLKLVPPNAPYLKGADITLMADCSAFAYANIHRDFIRNRVAIIACPKLDDTEFYLNKLKQMMEINNFRSIEVVMMEVPCCQGLGQLVEAAASEVKSKTHTNKTIIGLDGSL